MDSSTLLNCNCKCGQVKFQTTIPTTKTFICHCDMCPPTDRSYQNAAPWIAISRPIYTGNLEIIRSSNFATRTRCINCKSGIYLRYDCEPNTDWILGTIFNPSQFNYQNQPLEHIHSNTNGLNPIDQQPSSTSWGTWTPDLCRPANTSAPSICMTCFQLQTNCICNNQTINCRVADNFRECALDTNILTKGLLYRSSTPWNASLVDVQFLMNDLGIRSIFDLRTPFERIQTQDVESNASLAAQKNLQIIYAPLLNQHAMGRYLFSVAGWSDRFAIIGLGLGLWSAESIKHRINPLVARGGLIRMYKSIVDDTQMEILKILQNMLDVNGLPCVVHCTSGKDRTGVLCALVLKICGASDDVVYDDYNKSELYIEEMFGNPKNPTVAHFTDRNMMQAPKQVMKELLNYIRKKYVSVENYVDNVVGFGSADRQRLVMKLTNRVGDESGAAGAKL